MWCADFETDSCAIIACIFVLSGVIFIEKDKVLVAHDQEQAAKEAKRQSDAAIARAEDNAKAAETAKAAAKDAAEDAEARLATATEGARAQARAIELYATAIDVVGKGLVICAAHRLVVKHVNTTWEEITGYSRAEVVGREGGTKLLQGPDTDAAAVDAMRNAIREGVPYYNHTKL